MTISTRYSHAAPYIRQAAAYSAHRAITSSTQRDTLKAWAECDGLMTALSILLRSPEGEADPGTIAEEETIPTAAVAALKDRWGSRRVGEDLFPLSDLPVPSESPVEASRDPREGKLVQDEVHLPHTFDAQFCGPGCQPVGD